MSRVKGRVFLWYFPAAVQTEEKFETPSFCSTEPRKAEEPPTESSPERRTSWVTRELRHFFSKGCENRLAKTVVLSERVKACSCHEPQTCIS